jgi:serine-type D-Ala-D-Ala carboxypeptidase (penicillin-binding protein 5/6)
MSLAFLKLTQATRLQYNDGFQFGIEIMKKFIFLLLLLSPLVTFAAKPAAKPEVKPVAAAPQPAAPVAFGALNIAAKSYVLRDFQSGQLLVSQNPDLKVEPASLTKLMTAYLAFKNIKEKRLAEDQPLPVSEKAWKAIGSRMFIDLKIPVTVNELLRGMIIQSGNDASIALAEAIGGSEEVFAELMNKEALQLGMKNTHFLNATGLPDAQHYSTAEDLSLLAAAIIRDFPQFYTIYSTRDYKYNGITQPNRNRLLWLDPTVDGMKTGHTDNAGWCLVSSAKRSDRRLISVVLGTASDTVRTIESQKLLNYGFQFYDTKRMYRQGESIASLEVYKGQEKTLSAGFGKDLFLTLPRSDFEKIQPTLTTTQPLIAPLAKGQEVGMMKLTLGDKTIAQYPVVALDTVPVAGIFRRTWDSVRLMLK